MYAIRQKWFLSNNSLVTLQRKRKTSFVGSHIRLHFDDVSRRRSRLSLTLVQFFSILFYHFLLFLQVFLFLFYFCVFFLMLLLQNEKTRKTMMTIFWTLDQHHIFEYLLSPFLGLLLFCLVLLCIPLPRVDSVFLIWKNDLNKTLVVANLFFFSDYFFLFLLHPRIVIENNVCSWASRLCVWPVLVVCGPSRRLAPSGSSLSSGLRFLATSSSVQAAVLVIISGSNRGSAPFLHSQSTSLCTRIHPTTHRHMSVSPRSNNQLGSCLLIWL